MITTKVLWKQSLPLARDEMHRAIVNKRHEMIYDGKTDGSCTHSPEGTVRRQWRDELAAQEWLDFCRQFDPVICEIEQQ